MTPQEYAAAQATLTAATAAYTTKFAQFMLNPLLTTAQWLGFLQLLFNDIQRQRLQSAMLAREFYDSERKLHNPTLPRHDVYLPDYDYRSFVVNMEPARVPFSKPQAPPQAVTNLVMHAVREVEMGGRELIVRSVEADYELLTAEPDIPEPEPQPVSVAEQVKVRIEIRDGPKKVDPVRENLEREIAESAGRPAKSEPLKVKPTGPVRGWARVATGKETCAFCLMLISRGPVYLSAKGAGLDLHDAGASAALAEGKDVSEWMNEWHIGCDCKVVPVYDKFDWPGKDAAARALQLWIDAGHEADKVLADNPGKKYYSHKARRWLPTTENRETINALRRRLESGEISTSEFAALAA